MLTATQTACRHCGGLLMKDLDPAWPGPRRFCSICGREPGEPRPAPPMAGKDGDPINWYALERKAKRDFRRIAELAENRTALRRFTDTGQGE